MFIRFELDKAGNFIPFTARLRYFEVSYYGDRQLSTIRTIIKGIDFVEAKCEFLMSNPRLSEVKLIKEITE